MGKQTFYFSDDNMFGGEGFYAFGDKAMQEAVDGLIDVWGIEDEEEITSVINEIEIDTANAKELKKVDGQMDSTCESTMGKDDFAKLKAAVEARRAALNH